MYSKIAIECTEKYDYPTADVFRPDVAYPEYYFKDNLSKEPNHVYEMVRNGFHRLEYDQENFGSSNWNPLGHLIKRGDCVLVKPNFVMDTNRSGQGTDCLFTQPSVVAAVIDYIVIALQGAGKILLADAPMQECNFEHLIKEAGYDRLENFYLSNLPQGIKFEILDLRDMKSTMDEGGVYRYQDIGDNGMIVDLGQDSEFSNITKKDAAHIRITNYDPAILQKHHNMYKHEYCVHQEVLKADVIINMPKPKTHRKGGVTISLKNMIGVNARKEFLPHHTNGAKTEGGDEYEKKSWMKKIMNFFGDRRNFYSQTKNCIYAARIFTFLGRVSLVLCRILTKDKYEEGNWYGNDTIGKTITDINKIVFFCDKKGVMQESKQRKYLIVADMIVAGEGEGPIMPERKNTGMIAIGEDPVCFDEGIATLMGADIKMFSTFYHIRNPIGKWKITKDDLEAFFVSNNDNWNHCTITTVPMHSLLYFKPSKGWEKAYKVREK